MGNDIEDHQGDGDQKHDKAYESPRMHPGGVDQMLNQHLIPMMQASLRVINQILLKLGSS